MKLLASAAFKTTRYWEMDFGCDMESDVNQDLIVITRSGVRVATGCDQGPRPRLSPVLGIVYAAPA